MRSLEPLEEFLPHGAPVRHGDGRVQLGVVDAQWRLAVPDGTDIQADAASVCKGNPPVSPLFRGARCRWPHHRDTPEFGEANHQGPPRGVGFVQGSRIGLGDSPLGNRHCSPVRAHAWRSPARTLRRRPAPTIQRCLRDPPGGGGRWLRVPRGQFPSAPRFQVLHPSGHSIPVPCSMAAVLVGFVIKPSYVRFGRVDSTRGRPGPSAPGATRTRDRQIRRLLLYPAELRRRAPPWRASILSMGRGQLPTPHSLHRCGGGTGFIRLSTNPGAGLRNIPRLAKNWGEGGTAFAARQRWRTR